MKSDPLTFPFELASAGTPSRFVPYSDSSGHSERLFRDSTDSVWETVDNCRLNMSRCSLTLGVSIVPTSLTKSTPLRTKSYGDPCISIDPYRVYYNKQNSKLRKLRGKVIKL